MDEKDLSLMSDEELKEFIKKFYSELDKKPDCAGCPVFSCPLRRPPREEESQQLADEEE
ncbi:MAG: hypothetical protein QME85_07155 [Candidatus Saccharicenans sp.]|nr:hypothetical protein [Candidatus Saccharicenans sp.]MDI6849311.1 hypothetical protein [Candidatus Saccharicenans sp.]